MSRKMLLIAIVLPFLMGAVAQAVTVDLSSPQEGTVLGPGDSVEVTMTITNETAEKDIVFVWISLTIDADGQEIVLGQARPLRLKLEAGEAVSKTIAATLPEIYLPGLPAGSYDVTISAVAEGKKSNTTDEDMLWFTLVIPAE